MHETNVTAMKRCLNDLKHMLRKSTKAAIEWPAFFNSCVIMDYSV